MSTRLPKRAHPPRHLPVGRILRDARQAAGLTQKAVARRLFVSSNTICHWETGHRLPHVEMLDAYLRVVGASLTLGVIDERAESAGRADDAVRPAAG